VRPVLGRDSQEYQTLSNLAESFLEYEGPRMQQYLRFRSLFKRNYVTEWWEKYVYLNNRNPLMIGCNYYILGSVVSPTTSQTARAAVLVHLFTRFKRLVDREQLEPLFLRDIVPTCMNQYRRLFSTTRIPDRDCDELQHLRTGRHVIVQRNGCVLLRTFRGSFVVICFFVSIRAWTDSYACTTHLHHSTHPGTSSSCPCFDGMALYTPHRSCKKLWTASLPRRIPRNSQRCTPAATLGWVAVIVNAHAQPSAHF